MNKKNYLNLALLIIGASILILGAVLFLTVPAEIKDSFREMHINKFSLENGEWNDRFGSGVFPGTFDPAWKRSHGGIWVFPLAILVLVLIISIGRRVSSNYFGHRRHGFMENPINILRRSYADGRMTREEYLEKKTILEQEKEV